jgi:ATP-dependent DNA helicase PIF1
MFNQLDEDEYHFEFTQKTTCTTIVETGKPLSVEQIMKCSRMTEKEKEFELQNLLNNSPCSEVLTLKKNANVLCTVNIDIDNGICNGSQGIVLDIIEKGEKTSIVVRFTNGLIRLIEPHCWQSEEYPCIAITQYPLCLAWALTIHKIQGATLSMAEIDIGNSVFEYGQTYVALSRVQSLDGLYLAAFEPHRIRANPKVIEFYHNIPKKDYSAVIATNPFESFELKEEVYETVKDPTVKIIKL